MALPLILSGLIFGIAGLILGIVAIYEANQARDLGVTGGMQSAGFVLGIVGICLSALGLIACIACAGAIGAGYGALSSLGQSAYY